MGDSYIVSGMVSMLSDGTANPYMSFEELQEVCDEPDLHEFDSLQDMRRNWHEAKERYRELLGTTALL